MGLCQLYFYERGEGVDREAYLMEHWADFFAEPKRRGVGRSLMFGMREVEDGKDQSLHSSAS